MEHAQLARSIADIGSAVLASLEYYAVISQLAFSREQEAESDALGVSWMNAAGYDPAPAAALWEFMGVEEALSKRRVPTFLRSHPPPPERQARIAAQAVDLQGGETRPAERKAGAYGAQVAPFRNAWLHYAAEGLSPELAQVLLERQRHIGAPAGLVSFHEARMYRRRNAAGDGERALVALRGAIAEEGCPPEAYREYGLALWDAGRNDEARAAFAEYLAADPDAVDHAMIESYLEELR